MREPHSRGETICLLDADDLWEPRKVKTVVSAFETPGADLVHHPLRPIDSEGRPVAFEFGWSYAEGDVAETMRRNLLPWQFAPTSGLCLRRSACEVVFPLRTGLRHSADELIAPGRGPAGARHLRE